MNVTTHKAEKMMVAKCNRLIFNGLKLIGGGKSFDLAHYIRKHIYISARQTSLVLCLFVGAALFMSSCEKPLLPEENDDGTRAANDSTSTGGNVNLNITITGAVWDNDTTHIDF